MDLPPAGGTEPTSLCRDCGRLAIAADSPLPACPGCGSSRQVVHPELARLTIAHVDCDAYYAAIEKRDRPELHDKPVIVGGGMRGVVTTCCYVARRYGVRSAMPMARALQLCPPAVVIHPDMEKYQRESGRIRELMRAAAARVEQVSIDEAYLDFGDGSDSRDEPPARSLARLSLQIERRIGVTVSIGLGANKMLAKLASDLDKPRGFAVIGAGDAVGVIGPMNISVLPGVGPVMSRRLEELGFLKVSDLWHAKEDDLILRFGLWGRRLMAFSRAEDNRKVAGERPKSVTISAETTFDADLRDFAALDRELKPLCEILSRRLIKAGLAATGLTLKLRRADRQVVTRACRLYDPTVRASVILEAVRPVLAAALDGRAFRLVGVAATRLVSHRLADPPDLFTQPPDENE
jgi:DNA polymerase-4